MKKGKPMNDLITRQTAIDALVAIKYRLWEIDIPFPRCPEYVEHHEQIKSVMKLVDEWMKKVIEQPSIQQDQDIDYLVESQDSQNL